MERLRRGYPALLLAVILLVGLGLRVWGLGWGLHDATVSRRPHPDEWVVYWVFHWFDTYPGLNPCPHQGTQCFFDWGGLYLYLAYGVHMLLRAVFHVFPWPAFGAHADPAFVHAVLAGRILSVLMSAGTILLGYGLGSALRGRAAGIVAAAIIALSGLLVQLAHFATPDSTTIFFLSLTLLLCVRALSHPSPARFLVSGAAAGLATGSEYHMGLLLIPVLAAWAVSGRHRNSLLLAVVAFGAGWVVANPYAVIEPGAFLDANLHSVALRTVDSGAQYGDRWSHYGPAWLYVVRYPLGYGVGFAITIWLLLGVGWALLYRRRDNLPILLWIGIYLVLVTASPAKFMRYSAPLIPPLAALAGAFARDAWKDRNGVRSVRPLVAVCAAATLLYSFGYDAAYAQLFSSRDPRQVATSWIEHHASRDAPIGFEEIPDGLVNLPYFVTDAGYQPCFSQFEPANLQSPVSYFAVDEYSLEQHPDVDTSSVRAFRAALRGDPSYRPVFHVDPVPTFAGFQFPIDGSPHDWRYPAHAITLYRHALGDRKGGGQCYATLREALVALKAPSQRAGG